MARRKASNSGLRIFNRVLLVMLGVALLVIYFQKGEDLELPSVQEKSSLPGSGLEPFVKKLTLGNPQIWEDHQEAARFLSQNRALENLSGAEVKNWNLNQLPSDYRPFFEDFLPRYLNKPSDSFLTFSHPDILLSMPPDRSYRAFAFFNKEEWPVQRLPSMLPESFAEDRFMFTGTYTSPLGMPAGLAIGREGVINPFLQSWEGLILIQNGKIYLNSLFDLHLGNRSLHVAENFRDFQDFVRHVEAQGGALLQSHLLVYEGRSALRAESNKRKMRRRVIFQTGDGGLHLFDSRDRRLSFEEVAGELIDKFKAEIAINLDMGGFNYFQHHKKSGKVEDLSELHQGVHLSNVLVIDCCFDQSLGSK